MSGDRTRSGGIASDQEILDVFRTADRPFQTASDIAEAIGVERQSAHRRLQALHEDGRVNKEKVGAHAVVWWLAAGQGGGGSLPEDDPFVTAETFSSGRDDISESVDEEIAAAGADERDT